MVFGLYVNGKWIKSSSGKTFDSINPATEKAVGTAYECNERDVKEAIDSAAKAYETWSAVPPPKRGQILFKVAELLRKDKERLAKMETTEMGKVLPEARGDVQEAIDVAEYMAAEGRRLFGHTTTSELPSKFAMTVRRPIGVVWLITPWNFPIAIPAWKIMAALICGNTVVFKPSSETPLCAVEFVKLLEEAGVPDGVVNMVAGPGGTVGKEIVTNKKIRAVSFTGSRETGEWITKNAGVKRVGLELGGKNGIIVMDDADLSVALDGIIWGAFGTTGQRCTAASRVIVHSSVKEKLLKALIERTKKLRLGSGLLKTTDIGPLVNVAAVEKCDNYVRIGQDEGARLVAGG
ncbi:MAG TPA: aldehyde dehydrogenase family protein, partial [archaeon]|nr:aldehyde dehydrogenase family protein [archaeon]